MTTTELYSGYGTEGGKPSSRVSQPPGGGSSNIFGGPEPTPQQQVKKEQEKPVEPSQQGEQANPTADAQGEYQKNKPKARVPQFNPITGEEYPADYGQQNAEGGQEEQGPKAVERPSSDNENANSQSNGATKDNRSTSTENTKAVPASATFQKVRQPPGGVSTGLW